MPKKDEFHKLRSPYVATDIIIEDECRDRIVLIERKNPPYGLALPGGFAEYGLSFEDNAVKEAKEETSLDVTITDPEKPLCVHSKPDRDPRAHIASLTYIARGAGTLKADDDAKKARWVDWWSLEEILKTGDFAFPDHKRALKEYIHLRRMELPVR
jgi:ADP-ribose pyrophosphatase YjhB (NUDIX family)